jgi:lysophospholipid acyltransferase (LPLAT)-like uncharacterized protein
LTMSALSQRRALSRWLRRLEGSEWVLRTLAAIAAGYVRLIRATTQVRFEPGNPFILYRDALPGIGTLWHGNQFLIATIKPPDVWVRILISKHRDGEITARLVHKFGVETIRGSGVRSRRWVKKGGVEAFLGLRASLAEGYTVILTADGRRGVSRQAGLGIIALARASGKGIVGIGVAASRAIVLNSWDRTVLPLPFSRIAVVAVPVVTVPADADAALMEAKRRELEDAMNAASERAYQIVRHSGFLRRRARCDRLHAPG